MFLTIIVFILILSILIFVHEFGHFFSAKKTGMKVEEFGFGFPPRIFGKKVGETIYSLNLIPFGGFVKIYGESGEDRKNPRSFSSKGAGKRALVLVAGVIMNLVLAMVLFWIIYGIGAPQAVGEGENLSQYRDLKIQIVGVAKSSPAEAVGLEMGDAILKIGSMKYEVKSIEKIEEIQEFTQEHLGQEIILVLKRGDEVIEKRVVPRENPPEGEGPIGFSMAMIGVQSLPWYEVIWRGAKDTVILTGTIIAAFFKIFTHFLTTGKIGVEIAGPVGIAVLTSKVTEMGFVYILQFMALISINLAIINAFPFPALDGGRLLFLAIEKIKGSPVKKEWERTANTIGFALLILLMIAVTFRDIMKLF